MVDQRLTAREKPALSKVNHVRRATKEAMNTIITYGQGAFQHSGQTLTAQTFPVFAKRNNRAITIALPNVAQYPNGDTSEKMRRR